jgi:hypothetical protein
MTEKEIPDYNIFMICEQLNKDALSELATDYYFRNCRGDELEIWKAFPFDTEIVPREYENMMNQIIKDTYSIDMELSSKTPYSFAIKQINLLRLALIGKRIVNSIQFIGLKH